MEVGGFFFDFELIRASQVGGARLGKKKFRTATSSWAASIRREIPPSRYLIIGLPVMQIKN